MLKHGQKEKDYKPYVRVFGDSFLGSANRTMLREYTLDMPQGFFLQESNFTFSMVANSNNNNRYASVSWCGVLLDGVPLTDIQVGGTSRKIFYEPVSISESPDLDITSVASDSSVIVTFYWRLELVLTREKIRLNLL